jgi:hypothetical protein
MKIKKIAAVLVILIGLFFATGFIAQKKNSELPNRTSDR